MDSNLSITRKVDAYPSIVSENFLWKNFLLPKKTGLRMATVVVFVKERVGEAIN